MGATVSSKSAATTSAPLRERSEETFVYGTDESYTNENMRQRTRTSAFDVGEEPRSQGPSPYATFRGEEWWSQRPSAPSLSNLRSSRRETLLTYAAQMTGWQTAEGHGPSFSQHHQEAMELSRTISQLAMANQQLASAHTATLAHLEALYTELKKEREWRKRGTLSDASNVLKERLTMEPDDEDEERRRMELRIDRLETLLIDEPCQSRQTNLRYEEDRILRSRIERLESMMKSEDERQKCANVYRPVESRDNDRLLNSPEVPDCESKNQATEIRVDVEDQPRSIPKIHDEEVGDSRSNDETDHSAVKLHLDNLDKPESKVDGEEGSAAEQVIRLTEEIERLKAERLEYETVNERLSNELTEQKFMVEKLSNDHEESEVRHQELESSLQEREEEYQKLMEKFDVATKETERLSKEINAFNLQKDTADARISSLEQDLQNSLLEKEQIKNVESQKMSKLKAQLSEEVSDKKKQIKALEDALDEIQRLKETIKTERKSDDDAASKDDISPAEFIDDPQESPPAERANNIEDFKKELTMKREARQRAIAAVSSEMERLRRELDAEKEAHSETSRVLELLKSAEKDPQTNEANGSFRKSRAKDQKPDEHELGMKRVEAQCLSSILKVSDVLRNDIRFQLEKMDDLRYHLETEPDQHRHRIRCLTELTNRTREALHARERRCNQLKDHLAQILVRLGDRSFLDLKDDVGLECERQLESIHGLKSLYNERLKVLTELKDAATKELADVKERLDHSLKESECLEEDLRKADEKIDAQDTEISNLASQLGLTKADCRDLQNQMSLINGLFTQMLLGATSADMDLDRLTQLLQENHDLICDMAREEGTEAAALPKLLLDLIEQVEGSKGTQKRVEGENGTDGETEKKEDDLQQEDIAHNLPKVWRVLLELLSCHAEGAPSASAASSSDPNSCYKSVDTPAGPRLVISVSKTYIRLKELILEKKHLEKEMNRMKQLNTHLESKLGEQEKRLSTVSAELSKTWTIVDRMQAQHHQLHTHEKILRYELQQKRKLLQELKQELEYCREKWESARQKNTNTELEWRSLRREFAARKALTVHDSFSNSAESGFSDERGDDTDEEDEEEERIRLGPRRKPRKESPRAPSPDTESEQPTDTELSEPKTGSSTTLEQRTPTPETEAELDETELVETILNIESTVTEASEQAIPESPQESLDPLDQALSNVIQNLIGIDEKPSAICESPIIKAEVTEKDDSEDSSATDSSLSSTSPDLEQLKTNDNSKEDSSSSRVPEDSQKMMDPDGEKTKTEEPPSVSCVPTVTSSTPVFSIGPFPPSAVTPSIVKNVQFRDPLIVGPSNQFFTAVFGVPLSDQRIDSPSYSSSSPESSQEREPESQKRATRSTENVTDSDVSVDSSSSLETVKEFPVSSCSPFDGDKENASCSEPAPRPQENVVKKIRTPEEALAAREDRLKRLEEQAKWLMNKMNATSRRGSALSTRLEELHEVYGEPPVPPPMPDILPSRRLRTSSIDLPRQVPESSSNEGTGDTENPSSSNRSNDSAP